MTTEEFWSCVGLGLKQQTFLILDSLSIRVSMMELESWSGYDTARKALFGVGRLGRFWCQRIRPWLRPRRHRALRVHFEEMQVIFQGEFLSAVLEAGAENIRD